MILKICLRNWHNDCLLNTSEVARELGPKGIRVNAVAPGIKETDMMKAVPKEVIEPMIERIPLRRLGPVSYTHLR